MQKIAIFILVALAAPMPAKRTHVQPQMVNNVATSQAAVSEVENAEKVRQAKVDEAYEKALAEDALAEDLAEEQREAVADPQQAYWYTHQGEFEFVAPALKNDEFTQQFELKEDYRLLRTKKFDVKLQEFENEGGIEVRKNINAPVLRVENYFWTMHNHQSATFKNEEGTQVGEYIMFKPHVINRRYTWRVAKMDDPDKILFTIQKRLYDDHCKYVGLFKCRPVMKIYVGHRGDKSTLIYYGVGDRDLDEPDFKFYHHAQEYQATKHKWVAKVDHKKTKGRMEEDKYKIKVKPGEDAALILLAAVCLDEVGDDARAAED